MRAGRVLQHSTGPFRGHRYHFHDPAVPHHSVVLHPRSRSSCCGLEFTRACDVEAKHVTRDPYFDPSTEESAVLAAVLGALVAEALKNVELLLDAIIHMAVLM
jgi:hypothetical protein